MLHITLDTCVWLGLLTVDFNNEDNYFEEICFLIENKYVIHIAPSNIIEEWNRNKSDNKENAVKELKDKHRDLLNFLKNDSTISAIYQPDKIKEVIQKRIERIDLILNAFSERAILNEDILIEAGNRNLAKFPPNHIKDGYKDTVNMLSLINHIKTKEYDNCLFTTIDGDFGITAKEKYNLHNLLVKEFKDSNLHYIYFGNKKNITDDRNNFGAVFFSQIKKEDSSIPSFQDYLKNKIQEEQSKTLAEKKSVPNITITSPDEDYLENIKYIDIIIARKTPTTFELELIKSLIKRHESYKQYFFNKIGSNGLV